MFSLQTFVLIFSFVIESNVVNSLNLKVSFAEQDNVIMKRVNSLLQSSDPTCVISVPTENHDFLDLISKEFSAKRTLLIVDKSFNNIVKRCRNVLLLDVPSSSVCDLLTQDKRSYLGLNHNIVLCYLRAAADLTTLQGCSSSFGQALVKVLPQSGRVFVLDSPFASHRTFVPDDSTTPSFLTSLRGKRLGVATFNFPPFSIIRENSNNVGK